MMHICASTTLRNHLGGVTHGHGVTAVPSQAAGQRARQMLTAHSGATSAYLPPAVCQTRGRGNRDIVWCPGGIPASACSCQPPASSPRCGAQQEADSRAAASAAGCGALPLQLHSPTPCTSPWWLQGPAVTPCCPCCGQGLVMSWRVAVHQSAAGGHIHPSLESSTEGDLGGCADVPGGPQGCRANNLIP